MTETEREVAARIGAEHDGETLETVGIMQILWTFMYFRHR